MVDFKGSGNSVEDPIFISGVSGHFAAVDAEYVYLREKFGERGSDWTLIQQSLMGVDDRQIDKMDIKLASGETVIVYFDITEWFGKW
ncbi:MAG: hypothetical protein RTU30_09585 [Candidatus Thorarchaeota archaeon]